MCILELKKIAVICFVFVFADGILLTLISVFLRALGEPGSMGLPGQVFSIIIPVLGIGGLLAFCGFVLSAFGFAIQKFPGRDDDIE